ncbi:MAG: Vitamin B12 dependent methionine synthase activation subunit [Clostridia bacterium]|nr:Vitamin B12 dependent methionine synthase activation subunit [Clostridia bacterium]
MLPILIQLSDSRQLTISKKEVLRYLGVKESNDQLDDLIEKAIDSVHSTVSLKASYIRVPILVEGEEVDFGFDKVKSQSLAKNLKECKEAFVFVASLGVLNDKAIEKNFKLDRLNGAIFDCVSTTLIESFCDYINEYFGEKNVLRPRFSPGYGDFSIEHQRSILSVLDAYKNVGITLTDSLMMIPSKSVTAVVGIL